MDLQQHNTYTRGFTTTIERAQQQILPTYSVSGVKRKHFDINDSKSISATINARDRPRLTVSTIRRVTTADNIGEAVRPPCTPRPSQHPLLSLSHASYGLVPKLVTNLENLGVSTIYPWQSSCILGKGLLDGQKSLIYTAPTGGGKSLVAEVLMLRRVLENGKAILVLPYVALVQEKTRWLRRVVEGLELRVTGMFGGSKIQSNWNDFDIAVCTIEKANMLINTAIEESQINDLGVVVLDELHMIDDEHRGYLLELMMTKLVFIGGIQIIGMSATLSDPKMLADWLQAKFYVSKYRPIPIEEHIVYDNAIYPTANSKDFFRTATQLASQSTQVPPQPSYTIAKSVHEELSNPMANAVVALAVETALAGFGSLVFCSSRQSTQRIASLISQAMTAATTDEQMDVLASLEALSGGFEPTFSQTIPYGVAFHHAGLTIEERDIVAEAFDAGVLKVMVATCSLAAGINLPARRVILYGARMGRDLVGPAMLRQMRGRAGRKGKDEIGQTYLCCHKEDLETVAEIFEAELPPVLSCLVPEKRGLKRAILEVIAIRLASSHEQLQAYLQLSLLWQTTDHNIVYQMLNTALESLLQNGLVELVLDNAYIPTRAGAAIVGSGLDPDDGIFVHKDLRKAISSLVLATDVHVLYLFTPIPQSSGTPLTSDISWPFFRTLLDSLDEASLHAMRLIGISPALVNSMAQSGMSDLKENTSQELNIARIYRRAYSAFALRDLCNEVSIAKIALKYSLPRGQVQNLAQTCHGFAAGMIKFCQRMSMTSVPGILVYDTARSHRQPDPLASGFSMLGAVLEHMQDRLRAGARADLLDMAQVTFVKGRMARVLYEAGFRGVRALANADPQKDILPVMMAMNTWKTKIHRPTTNPTAGRNETELENGTSNSHDLEERKKKLEEKLLAKAEIMVSSAGRIWERECLQQVLAEEE